MEIQFPFILDGSTGTQLQKRGFTGDQCAEKWVLDHPEVIKEVQRAYVEAGSNVVYCATFGANRIKLEEYGLGNETREMNIRLAMLSREAVDGKAYVAGDIAPTGKFLAPVGNATFEELYEVYKEQASALEEAGVDMFAVETMMSLADARAALLAVKSVSRKPVFVSFSSDTNGKTITGGDINAALVILQSMGADVFGLNCSSGPKDMLAQIKKMTEYAEVPMLAKPNAGIPEIIDGKAVYDCPVSEYTACIPELAASGVIAIGGCCGSEPEHIAGLARTAKYYRMEKPHPAHNDMLIASTEKKVKLLAPNTACTKILKCDDKLPDILENEEEVEGSLTGVEIENEEQLAVFENNQYAFMNPICIMCEDAKILEKALRVYQGRALYEGNIDKGILSELSKKYGLIY